MTCKDCLSFDVCKETNKFKFRIMGVPFTGVAYLPVDKESCKNFKDKSKIIELPCKVGDIVYEIHSHRLIDECFVYGDCYECNADPCPIEGRENEKVYEIKQRNLETIGAVVNVIQDFGKTVFLTREEAEVALKQKEERNGG